MWHFLIRGPNNMTELTLEQLNAQIDARIQYLRNSGCTEEDKKRELQKISRLIRLRDNIDYKHLKQNPDAPRRQYRVRGPMDEKEKEELMVLIESV